MSDSNFVKLTKTIEAMRVRNSRKVLLEREFLEALRDEYQHLANKIKELEDSSRRNGGSGRGAVLHGGGFK